LRKNTGIKKNWEIETKRRSNREKKKFFRKGESLPHYKGALLFARGKKGRKGGSIKSDIDKWGGKKYADFFALGGSIRTRVSESAIWGREGKGRKIIAGDRKKEGKTGLGGWGGGAGGQ